MNKKSSYKFMVCALLMGTLSIATNGQIAYEAMKMAKNKDQSRGGNFGGPSMASQVEYMQNAVDMIQNYI